MHIKKIFKNFLHKNTNKDVPNNITTIEHIRKLLKKHCQILLTHCINSANIKSGRQVWIPDSPHLRRMTL